MKKSCMARKHPTRRRTGSPIKTVPGDLFGDKEHRMLKAIAREMGREMGRWFQNNLSKHNVLWNQRPILHYVISIGYDNYNPITAEVRVGTFIEGVII